MKGYVICLCDRTGELARPWVEKGYTAVLVDPQIEDEIVPGYIKLGCRIEDCFTELSLFLGTGKVKLVAGFPPCTDVAVSGARWWEEKQRKDRYFQARATMIAEQCRTIGEMSRAAWFFENPVGAFSDIFGKPTYWFHPWEFTGYCAEDNYVKKTGIWAGRSFVMPAPYPALGLGEPDTRIWSAPPGAERANFRSATPKGFARAVYEANHGSNG